MVIGDALIILAGCLGESSELRSGVGSGCIYIELMEEVK